MLLRSAPPTVHADPSVLVDPDTSALDTAAPDTRAGRRRARYRPSQLQAGRRGRLRRAWPGLGPDRERGSETIEAAIGVPAFMLMVLLVIAAGRIAIAHQAVQAAAADAARSASISRTQQEARTAAASSARTTLSQQKLQCTSEHISVDTTGFAAPVGTPAAVTATVTCKVDLSGVIVPGLPGSQEITATMTSPLDTYRER